MDIRPETLIKAGDLAIKKLTEEHRRSGRPMVISPSPGVIQWVVPQSDGSLRIIKEKHLETPARQAD